MSEEINYFSVNIKKIEETINDYELRTYLNPCFATLSKDKFEEIENIALKAIDDIKEVLKRE